MRWVLAALAMMVPAAAPALPLAAAYVVMGEGGAIARVVTAEPQCPSIRIDGRDTPMKVRFDKGTSPLRPTASTPENSKPSVFPVLTCEKPISAGARRVSVGGTRLPVPKRDVRRIVVIGDTGCRLKAADSAWQACNDPARFPFARIVKSAARFHPDLIVHVGDYLYRENACPPGDGGCAGSPWGYGWDAWAADFFAPAAPLLAVAPLAPARGNHESCARAGQGWWRFLDGHAPAARQDCDDPANDHAGDTSPPYAVPLGRGVQLILLDLSAAGEKPLPPSDWRMAALEATYAVTARLAAGAASSIAVDHYPLLAFSAFQSPAGPALRPGNVPLGSVFGRHGTRLLPRGIDVVLSGHYHAWEQISFSTDQPSQFVTGFSGTLEDTVPLPATLPPGAEPSPGAKVAAFSSWIDGFGYMTLRRTGWNTWRAEVHAVDGRTVNRCVIIGRRSRCQRREIGRQRLEQRAQQVTGRTTSAAPRSEPHRRANNLTDIRSVIQSLG